MTGTSVHQFPGIKIRAVIYPFRFGACVPLCKLIQYTGNELSPRNIRGIIGTLSKWPAFSIGPKAREPAGVIAAAYSWH